MATTKEFVLVALVFAACLISCNKNGLEVNNDVQDVRIFQVDSGGSNNQGIVLLSDSNILIYGCLNLFNLNRFVFIKYSPDGKIIWARPFPIQDHVLIYAVLPLDIGEFVTVGTDQLNNTVNIDWYDSNGIISMSRKNFSMGPLGATHELAALLDTKNNIVLVGSQGDTLFMLKYSTDGALLDEVKIPDTLPGINRFSIRIAEDDFGYYYVQGRYPHLGQFDNFLMKISSEGDFRWSSYTSDETLNCTPAGCIIQDGLFIHAFSTEGSGEKNAATGVPFFTFSGVLYDHVWDTAGNHITDQLINGLPENCIFTSVTPTSDGGCLLTGTTEYFGGDFISPSRVILVKFSSDFTLEWTKQIETYVPALGIDAVELKGCYYVSGTTLFADSVAYMMLLKTPAE